MEPKQLLDTIEEVRHLSTVISNFLEGEVDEDGRIRTSYSFVETGRFSSHEDELGRGSHLQNVPPEIRKMFVADAGYTLIEADKSQGEARIVAWLAGEERMKKVFLSGEDIHQFNAANLGCDRTYAKTRTHGWNYCLGRKRVRGKRYVYSSEDEARDRYFQRFPRILQWQDSVVLDGAKRRFLINPFGRRRYFFDRIEWVSGVPEFTHTTHQMVAYMGQSTLVDDLNIGLVSLFYEVEPDFHLLHQGHDSVLMQVPEGSVERGVEVLKRHLEREFYCGSDLLTIPIEIKQGKNWGLYHEKSNKEGMKKWDG